MAAAKTAKKAGPKTVATKASVDAFLAAVKDETRRRDCERVVALLRKVTGEKPRMWGPSIVGFGTYRYVYASGRSGDWPLAAFSPRKRDLTVYLMPGFEREVALLSRLGPHTLGKSCLYLKGLEGIDLKRLEKLVAGSVSTLRRLYPARAAVSASGGR